MGDSQSATRRRTPRRCRAVGKVLRVRTSQLVWEASLNLLPSLLIEGGLGLGGGGFGPLGDLFGAG